MTKYEFTRLIIEKIELEKEKIKEQWFNPEGTPTRHFVLDDLLPESICQQIYDAFPKDANGFYSRESFREKKRTSASLDQYAPILGEITYAIQSNEVVNMISDLIGITKFKPDPSLYAGG